MEYLLLLSILFMTRWSWVHSSPSSQCHCKIKGCHLTTGDEYFNSSYTIKSNEIAGAPLVLDVNLVGDLLNITWELPTIGSQFLQGFHLTIEYLTGGFTKDVHYNLYSNHSYYLITSNTTSKTSVRKMFLDCIRIPPSDFEFWYQYKITVASLPRPADSLSTNNAAVIYLRMPYPKYTKQSSMIHLGVVLTTGESGGQYSLKMRLLNTSDVASQMVVDFTPCECHPGQPTCKALGDYVCNKKLGRQRENFISRLNDQPVTKLYPQGCYSIIGEVYHKQCKNATSKCLTTSVEFSNCGSSCMTASFDRISLGSVDCCTEQCPFDGTIHTPTTITDSQTHPIAQLVPAPSPDYILPSVIGVSVLLAIIVISVAIFFRCRGCQIIKIRPAILLLYSDDHHCHMRVLDTLVIYLKTYTGLDVIYYKTAPDRDLNTKKEWVLGKLKTTRYLMFVDSEYAWVQCRAGMCDILVKDTLHVTVEGGILAEAFTLLKTEVELGNRHQVIRVHFPYTKDDFLQPIYPLTELTFGLMDDVHQLVETLQKVVKRKVVTPDTYRLSPEALKLEGMIHEASEYQLSNAMWCQNRHKMQLSPTFITLFKNIMSTMKEKNSEIPEWPIDIGDGFLPPESVISENTSYADIILWLRLFSDPDLMSHIAANTEDRVAGLMQRSIGNKPIGPSSEQDNQSRLLRWLDHIDSVSQYDSGVPRDDMFPSFNTEPSNGDVFPLTDLSPHDNDVFEYEPNVPVSQYLENHSGKPYISHEPFSDTTSVSKLRILDEEEELSMHHKATFPVDSYLLNLKPSHENGHDGHLPGYSGYESDVGVTHYLGNHIAKPFISPESISDTTSLSDFRPLDEDDLALHQKATLPVDPFLLNSKPSTISPRTDSDNETI